MHPETRLHISLVEWWGFAARGYGLDARLLSHCPNGGKRRPIEAGILKAMGVRAGAEDLHLAVPCHGKHGLYMELKSPVGKTTPAQREMMALHAEQGYAVLVVKSVDEGVAAIINYLKTGSPVK